MWALGGKLADTAAAGILLLRWFLFPLWLLPQLSTLIAGPLDNAQAELAAHSKTKEVKQ